MKLYKNMQDMAYARLITYNYNNFNLNKRYNNIEHVLSSIPKPHQTRLYGSCLESENGLWTSPVEFHSTNSCSFQTIGVLGG